MKKKLIIAPLVVALAAIATYLLVGNKSQQQVTFESTTVTRGNLSTSVTATGTVEPVTQVEVGTQVSGIVNKLHVDYNSEVHRGRIVFGKTYIPVSDSYKQAFQTFLDERS